MSEDKDLKSSGLCAVNEEAPPVTRPVRGESGERERNSTCGQHPILGHVGGCDRVLDVIDLYRCADCQTAFCRECIRRHFRDQTPEEQERMRRLENDLAGDGDDYEEEDSEQ